MQESLGGSRSEAERQLATRDARAQLDAQIVATSDQISHMKGRMHETTQIVSRLLDIVVGRPQEADMHGHTLGAPSRQIW